MGYSETATGNDKMELVRKRFEYPVSIFGLT